MITIRVVIHMRRMGTGPWEGDRETLIMALSVGIPLFVVSAEVNPLLRIAFNPCQTCLNLTDPGKTG